MRLFRRRKRLTSLRFVDVEGQRIGYATPEPNVLIIGEDLVRGFEDPGPPPTQADLERVVGTATAVAVRGVFDDDAVLYETEDPADLTTLREALRIEGETGHCMCLGTVAFVFRRAGEDVGTVTLHHGESLRWDPFFYNAPLVESDPILDWLSARGVPGPREEHDEAMRDAEEFVAAAARWRAAMPPVLEPFRDSTGREQLSVFLPDGAPNDGEPVDFPFEWPEVAEALTREYPDEGERARVLLEWFGKGAGPWSGFPVYEGVPEWCLLQMRLDVIVQAAESEPQTEALLEGAARLLSSWGFGQERGGDLARVPADLKRRLLEHSLASPDDDKRSRAMKAFTP